jgi:hypothetical protein
MITRHFGVPLGGLVRTSAPEPASQPGMVGRLRKFCRRLFETSGPPRPARLSPAERRKLFRVIEGGKA